MFAKLKGIVDTITEENVILDVNGVGYLVHTSRTTIGRLGATGTAASLLVETHVRENNITLYGFCTTHERDWFRRLITVQGVGPKAALAILSVLTPEQLITALASADARAISRADGVGPKLAARIAAEFKGKTDIFLADTSNGPSAGVSDITSQSGKPTAGQGGESSSTPGDPANTAAADAVSALVNLGYGRSEAFSAVASTKTRLLREEPDTTQTVSQLIKESLKELAQ